MKQDETNKAAKTGEDYAAEDSPKEESERYEQASVI
jgi:hypothetical protein